MHNSEDDAALLMSVMLPDCCWGYPKDPNCGDFGGRHATISRMVRKAFLLTFGLAGPSTVFVALALQPPSAMFLQLFEDALTRQKEEYGVSHPRTAQAARDLGLFLRSQGDTAGARDALAEAVRIDEKALGPAAAQTFADVAELA